MGIMKKHTVAMITFLDNVDEGYLNIPPCNKKDKQYLIFKEGGIFKCNYKDQVKNVNEHVTFSDMLNIKNAYKEKTHTLVELLNWDNIEQIKRRK